MNLGQKSRLQKLLSYIAPHKKDTIIGVVSLFIVNGLGVYIPLLIRDTVDDFKSGFTYDQLIKYVLLLFVLASVMWFIRMLSRIALFGVGRQVEFDLKQKIFEHLVHLEPSYFATNSSGDLINKATTDVDSIRRLLGFAILSIANIIFAYGFTLPAMLLIDVKLSLLAIIVYPMMLIIVQLFSEQLREQQREVQEELSNLSELIQEDMSGMSLIKIYAQEENEREAFMRKNRILLNSNLKLARTRNLLFPIVEGISYVSLLVLLFFGVGEISKGVITIGGFIALMLFVERLIFPTALLGFTITAYQRGEVSVDRVESIFLAQPKITNSNNPIVLSPDQVKGELFFKNLTYTYPNTNQPALEGINLTIYSGETLAIVGSIGSGKSTLANTIPRLLEIAPNQVYLDGIDITQIDLKSLRQAIAYVPQESFLFSTTIRDNIRYGNPVIDQKIVESYAKSAQIHDEILNFPQQYDTLVGERGITLSGGQRQRTSLARALLVDAPVLILDDALASVDNQTATHILQNLREGVQKKTVIFISHQLSACATADRIVVMNHGKITQVGSHEELITQEGLYQSLWEQYKLEEILK